jgi:proline iminopeptidase
MLRHTLLPMKLAFALTLLPVAFAGCLDPDDPGNLVPKTVDEDPTLPRIEVAGALFHAEAFGPVAAPTVIVLHGGPGADYRSQLPLRALADDGYRVQFWDQRGSGLSQRFAADSYTMPLLLEDLRLVVEQTVAPGQPFVFIGHSWGAMYATWFINEYGDYGGRLRGAILTEPGGFTKPQLEAFLARLVSSIDLSGEQFNDVVWTAQFVSADGNHARTDYLASLLAIRGAPSEKRDPANLPPLWRYGAVMGEKYKELALEQGFDWTTRLDAFAHKVLFLRGDLNTACTLASQQEMAAAYADAQITTIANAGHEVVWAQPEAYLAHTRDYLRTIGFSGGAQ